jgi:Ni/Fe-hydrogenase 1 B-type cytochrome subunit
MSHKLTRLEHPLPAVVMHWAHLLSFFVLIATGLQIHAHTNTLGPLGTVRQVHFVVMYVFILTTVVRIYWAFFGGGSAALGGLQRHRDWKFFGLTWADIKSLPQWIAYYLFIRKTRPHCVKYNPLQKLTYVLLFPLGILVMALTGFSLFAPTAEAMVWYTNLLGGLNNVRLVHYLVMWVLIVFFMIHLYLVVVEDPAEAQIMLLHSVPEDLRVSGDYETAGSGSSVQGEKA